jgi:hypothetical protein
MILGLCITIGFGFLIGTIVGDKIRKWKEKKKK